MQANGARRSRCPRRSRRKQPAATSRRPARCRARWAKGAQIPRSGGLSTAAKDKLPAKDFAFPKERKEPLTDARHVRNAIARFDQVEDVTDKERDEAWRRIVRAAKRFDVEVNEKSWRELGAGGKAKKRG